jgi:putative heme transporter
VTAAGVFRRWRGPLGVAVSLAFAGAVVLFVLPRVIDYGEVRGALADMSWPWLAVLTAVAALNIVTFAPTLMAALPGLRFRPALAVTLSSTASTYIAPGGAAVGIAATYAMLRGWGFRGRGATLAVAVTSAWNILFTFSAPAIALLLLSIEGGSNPALRTAATAGLAVFAALLGAFALGLRSARQARALGDHAARLVSRALRVLGREPVSWDGETLAAFRDEAVVLLKSRWPWLTVGTLAGHMTVYLVLAVTLPAVGIGRDEVSIPESFAAWSLVRLLAALPLTPGGFGIVEIGLSGSLIAFGGDEPRVFAAVLVYRFLTVVPPVLLGALSAATWRRHHPGWEDEGRDGDASVAS